MEIIRSIHTGTPEMKYFDRVISLLREASISYSPDWEDVIKNMKEGKSPEISAEEFIALYDVD
jgi:hypothetical protein